MESRGKDPPQRIEVGKESLPFLVEIRGRVVVQMRLLQEKLI